MKTDYSTAKGQEQLMRESVGQPTDFPRRPVHSGFTEGQILEHRDINLQHYLDRVTYLREGKPEGGNVVIVVKHASGTTGEWLARDFHVYVPQ